MQNELAELDKLREDYVTSKADEPESRDGDILGEDWEAWKLVSSNTLDLVEPLTDGRLAYEPIYCHNDFQK